MSDSLSNAFAIPPTPAWEGLHPVVVHFPIALLLIVPVLIVTGLAIRRCRAGLLLAAWALLFLGTIGAYIAVSTGEAAEENAIVGETIGKVLHEHEELAELARNIFTAYTLAYTLILIVAAARAAGAKRRHQPHPDRESPPASGNARALFIVHLLFIALYLPGMMVLINAAHLGGRVVHEYGVTAWFPEDRNFDTSPVIDETQSEPVDPDGIAPAKAP